MSREPIAYKEAQKFLRWHLGKGCFAPFTGQDWSAWLSFCYLLQLWGRGGGDDAIDAMRATLRCCQTKCHPVFVQTIPAMLDWGHVEEIWPRIANDFPSSRGLYAVRRAEDNTVRPVP